MPSASGSEGISLLYAVAALLLVLGGALKLVDPSGTVGALRALGLAVAPFAVRLAAGAELVVGGLALAVTSVVVAMLVAISYAAFGAVILVALVRRVPIDTCGCLGRLETPPSWRHLVVAVACLGGAVHELVDPGASLLERLGDDGVAGMVFAIASLVLVGVAVAALRAGRRPSVPR